MKSQKIKKRTSDGATQPAVYFAHQYRYRSVTGALAALAFPGLFATVTLTVCVLVLWLTLSYFLLGLGIVIGGFDKAALDRISPSLLVAIPLGLLFGWVSYRMLAIPRNVYRNASFPVRISAAGIQIDNHLHAWEDISNVGYTHVLPFTRGFLSFRFGTDDIWIPTQSWIPWRQYQQLREALNEHVRPDYPHLSFSHFSFSGSVHIPVEFNVMHEESSGQM